MDFEFGFQSFQSFTHNLQGSVYWCEMKGIQIPINKWKRWKRDEECFWLKT